MKNVSICVLPLLSKYHCYLWIFFCKTVTWRLRNKFKYWWNNVNFYLDKHFPEKCFNKSNISLLLAFYLSLIPFRIQDFQVPCFSSSMFFRFFKVQVFQGPGPSFKNSPQLFYFFYKELHDKMSKVILSSSDGWHWLSQHRPWQIADVSTDVLETWFFWDVSSRTNHFSFLSA